MLCCISATILYNINSPLSSLPLRLPPLISPPSLPPSLPRFILRSTIETKGGRQGGRELKFGLGGDYPQDFYFEAIKGFQSRGMP